MQNLGEGLRVTDRSVGDPKAAMPEGVHPAWMLAAPMAVKMKSFPLAFINP